MPNVPNNMPKHPTGDRGGNSTSAKGVRANSSFYRRGGESRQWPTTGKGASRIVRGRGHTTGSDSIGGKDMQNVRSGSNIRRRGR
jgi:hypothetical protein